MTIAKVLLALAVSALSSAPSLAADCDPAAILRQNIETYQSDFAFWLASANESIKQASKSNSAAVGLTYKGIPFSASDVSSLSQYVSEKSSFRLSERQSVSILRSTLSPESVNAYLGCIGANRGVAIMVPDSAMNADEFVVTIFWDPKYNPTTNKLELVVAGGTVEGAKDVEIPPTQSKSFVVKRDLKKPFYLTATIDGKNDAIELPVTPKFSISFEELFGPPLEKAEMYVNRGVGANTTDAKSDHACVTPRDGSILLPGTAIMDVRVLDSQRRSSASVDEDKSALRVCGTVSASSGAKEVQVYITGRLRVMEATVTQKD